MNPSFYPAAVALALLASCGEGAPVQAVDSASQEGSVFALPAGLHPSWEGPANGDWAERWISHLSSGSKETIRFAKARLVEMGTEAAPALEAALAAGAAEQRSFGRLVSLTEMLGSCGREESVDILLRVAETNSVSVVKTSALEAVGRLANPAAVPRLQALLPRLADTAPRSAALTALGKIADEAATAVLEGLVLDWLGGDSSGGGQLAWNALLLVEQPHVIETLKRLHPELPPYHRVQALTMRVGAGETGLAEQLRPYLDASEYPSPGTRSLAQTALAELGDWESVLATRDDPSPQMWIALIAQLRRPDAAAAGIGEDILDVYSQSEDQDLMFNALLGLVERGQSHRLEPWLRQLKEYPTGAGSMLALQVLSKPGMQDERAGGILIERWEGCTTSYRLDLIGGMVRSNSPEALTFLAAVAADSSEERGVRHKAAIALSNFGEASVDPMLRLWENESTLEVAAWILPGLGRYPDNRRVSEFMLRMAADTEIPDEVRKVVIDLFPQVFGGDALPFVLELRDGAERSDLRRYLEAMLVSYF